MLRAAGVAISPFGIMTAEGLMARLQAVLAIDVWEEKGSLVKRRKQGNIYELLNKPLFFKLLEKKIGPFI